MAGKGGARPGAGRKPGKVGEAKRTLSEMAKPHAEKAIATLIEAMSNPDAKWSERIIAADKLLDRGYGKAPQSIEHTGKDGGAIQTEDVSMVEGARRVAFLLAAGMRESDDGNTG